MGHNLNTYRIVEFDANDVPHVLPAESASGDTGQVQGVTSGTPTQPQPKPGAIAVDLDKTLAEYKQGDAEKDPTAIGAPIPATVDHVKQLLKDGKDVWIFSARADSPETVTAIKAWTKQHIGVELPVTNVKHPGFAQFIDDRAVTPGDIGVKSPAVNPEQGAGEKTPEPIKQTPAGDVQKLAALDRRTLGGRYAYFFDQQPNADTNVEQQMQGGLGRGSQALTDLNPKGLNTAGRHVYVVKAADVDGDGFIKPTAKPIAHVVIRKDGQLVYDAIQEAAGRGIDDADISGGKGVLLPSSDSSTPPSQGGELRLGQRNRIHHAPPGRQGLVAQGKPTDLRAMHRRNRMTDQLTISEAAQMLGVKRQQVYHLLWDGDLKGEKIGRNWLISASSVKKVLEARENRRNAAMGL